MRVISFCERYLSLRNITRLSVIYEIDTQFYTKM